MWSGLRRKAVDTTKMARATLICLLVVSYLLVLWTCTYATAALSITKLEGQTVSHGLLPHVAYPLARSSLEKCADWLQSLLSAPEANMPKSVRLQLLYEENVWKNSLVMWMFPGSLVSILPHFWQTWLRNMVFCGAVYFVVGGLWAYYIYFCFGDKLFKPGCMPAFADVFEQIKVSLKAMPLYTLLPTVTEFAAEKGWTMAYPRVMNVGLLMHLVYFVLFMTSVEFGIYWMHRGLHDIPWAYRVLHHDHHKYNKEHTLSPFAGLAFHPLDGILQALPYAYTCMFCPIHFTTLELLLFATGVWTTNIHDCLDGKTPPVMGGGYHLIHHTTYKHNYGQYLIYMDWLFGTLETPEEYEQRTIKAGQQVDKQ